MPSSIPDRVSGADSWSSRIILGSIAGGLYVAILDGIGSKLSGDADGVGGVGIAAVVGIALLVGSLAGLLTALLVLGTRVRGPARELTTSALLAAVRSPLGALVPAVLATSVVLVAAVPARAALLTSPLGAAAADLAAALVGFALLVFITRRLRAARGYRLNAALTGFGVAVVGVVGGILGLAARPSLLPSGLWDLVALGGGLTYAFGVVLVLPSVRVLDRVAWAACALSITGGGGALYALDKDDALRDEIASTWRPVSWVVERAVAWIDFDSDGFSPVFGGGDCDDFRDDVSPDGIEIAGNGIDENCQFGDRESKPPWPVSPTFVPLPSGFEQPKNILLISIDTLRADHLGAYGYRRRTSPRIDQLASGAVMFERAYSVAPTTRIAIPTLMAGRSIGEISWDRRIFPFRMLDSNVTMAEVLKDRGLKTAAFPTHRYLAKHWNFVQGFDHVDESHILEESTYRSVATGKALAETANEWIAAHARERFFAWIHFMDPHKGYVRHEDGTDFGSSPIDLYDGEIEYVDKAVGMVLDKLDELGISDETAVVVMADHGEFLGEHGRTVHGGCVWEEGNLIPLIVRAPGLSPRRVACLVAHTDVAPTILNLMGIDGSAHGMSGVSLIPEMTGRRCDDKRKLVVEMRHGPRSAPNLMALVGKRWKLVRNVTLGTYRLYDLQNDPRESRNVASENPKTFAGLKTQLLMWSEVYANRELAETRKRSVVEELPEKAERFNIRFDNGLGLVGLDFGDRTVSTNKPIHAMYYLRTPERIRGACRIYHYFVDEHNKTVLKEGHPPVAGSFPVHQWPVGGIVEDGFSIEVRKSFRTRGVVRVRVGLRCDRTDIPAVAGEIDEHGRASIGTMKVTD